MDKVDQKVSVKPLNKLHFSPLTLCIATVQLETRDFLDSQEERINTAERKLLQATENIIPLGSSKQMTACELVNLLNQSAQLQDEMTMMLYPKAEKRPTPRHWSVGRPLDTLVETDNETDGTITPGSALNPYFASSPATPLLNSGFKLSASTQKILQKLKPRDSEEKKMPTMAEPETVSEHSHGDEDSNDDDSAFYCATVRATEQQQHQQQQGKQGYAAPSSSSPTDRYIQIDKSAASPAPSMMTMDNTFLNAFEDHCSVTSDETPVLDRYRIDFDDKNPHGFRVVPNERRERREKNVEFSLKASPAVSTRVYRKTPFKHETPTIDENIPLKENADNTPPTRLSSFVKSPTDPTSALFPDKNESPLLNKDIRKRFHSLPTSLLPTTAELSKPKANTSFHSDTLPSDEGHYSPDVNESQSFKEERKRFHSLSPSLLYAQAELASTMARPKVSISPITAQEYESAPRIVKMQVTLADVQGAVEILNERLALHTSPIRENEAKLLLMPMPDRKSKAVLMSLCHWRRLLMTRKGQTIVFDVV
jgi:hypothetical protein